MAKNRQNLFLESRHFERRASYADHTIDLRWFDRRPGCTDGASAGEECVLEFPCQRQRPKAGRAADGTGLPRLPAGSGWIMGPAFLPGGRPDRAGASARQVCDKNPGPRDTLNQATARPLEWVVRTAHIIARHRAFQKSIATTPPLLNRPLVVDDQRAIHPALRLCHRAARDNPRFLEKTCRDARDYVAYCMKRMMLCAMADRRQPLRVRHKNCKPPQGRPSCEETT